jgi:hypothetical protein
MDMVLDNGVTWNVDGECGCPVAQPSLNPLLAVGAVVARVPIGTAQKCPTDTS